MKITVNKDASKKKLIEVADEIVEIAKKTANEGLNSFIHSKIDIRLNYNRIINLVEYKTDGYVVCRERGHSDYTVNFVINEYQANNFDLIQEDIESYFVNMNGILDSDYK